MTHIFALPRRLGLEFRLQQLLHQKAPLSRIAAVAKGEMEQLAAKDELVGPPYRYLTVTAQGITAV